MASPDAVAQPKVVDSLLDDVNVELEERDSLFEASEKEDASPPPIIYMAITIWKAMTNPLRT